MIIPPKPAPRSRRVSFLRYLRLFRKDLLSAQPGHLYRAKMAEFRTPMFRSFMINQTDLISEVLQKRPVDFPKSDRMAEGLRPLLGQSVFVTNGKVWQRQRRIIDPAFAQGRLKDSFQSVCDAAVAASERAQSGVTDVQPLCNHAAADVIFRALFSAPVQTPTADLIYHEFQRFQQSQPLLTLGALLPIPRWVPRLRRRSTRQSAKKIRHLIRELTEGRAAEISRGEAPDDLCTKIMTFTDPESGAPFTTDEMVDQVAIFLLAGHETSASALAWALYLVSLDEDVQASLREEATAFWDAPAFSALSKLRHTQNVFREALRLYPPVPMFLRKTTRTEQFRGRNIPRDSEVIVSAWHLHRNDRYWQDPDAFRPERFEDPQQRRESQGAYLPFSSGARVCPGAGFAMMEGCLLLSRLVRDWNFAPVDAKVPVPSAFLTVRSRNGIHLELSPVGKSTMG